jgi:hypothetical protein
MEDSIVIAWDAEEEESDNTLSLQRTMYVEELCTDTWQGKIFFEYYFLTIGCSPLSCANCSPKKQCKHCAYQCICGIIFQEQKKLQQHIKNR